MGCACDCGGTCGGVSVMPERDPLALRLAMASHGQTMGRFGVFKADVDALKRQIHPAMVATNVAVHGCAALSAGEVVAWDQLFEAWTAFHDEETPTLIGVGRRYDEAIAFREQLESMQQQFRPKCSAVPGPSEKTESDTSAITSAIKWGSVAVVAVAVVYGVRMVLPR